MGLAKLLIDKVEVIDNIIVLKEDSSLDNQAQTNEIFGDKWKKVDEQGIVENSFDFQKRWYLDLYGFSSEDELQGYLQSKSTILDAGCGLGYKSAWFAELAPECTVIGMDFSDAAYHAANNYKHIANLYFIKGDIANSGIKEGAIDYISCDQVLHHTEDPARTFSHLTSLLSEQGEFACYVYAKKALPRELLDDYFRSNVKDMNKDELWRMSEQLTKLGKTLSELNVKVKVPDLPLLNIKGGEYDIQRFIYWNFMKCFWNEEYGLEYSTATNFDWYAPSNAYRYSEEEYKAMINDNNLNILYFHREEACYSGRFKK